MTEIVCPCGSQQGTCDDCPLRARSYRFNRYPGHAKSPLRDSTGRIAGFGG